MNEDPTVYIRLATSNDYDVLDRTITRILSASLAEYNGVDIDDISGEEHFKMIIDDRPWPTFVTNIAVDALSGIRFVAVSSQPPRERDEDDDINVCYHYTLERLLGQRGWQVLPGSLRTEQLTPTVT